MSNIDLSSIDDRIIASKRRSLVEDLTCLVRLNANELKAIIVEDFSTHEPAAIESRFVSEINSAELTNALRSGMINVPDLPVDEQQLSDLRLMVFLKNWVGWHAFEQVIVQQDDGLNLTGFDFFMKARSPKVSNPRFMVYGYAQAYHYCLLGYWINKLRYRSLANEAASQFSEVAERIRARSDSYLLSLKLLVSAAPAFFNFYDTNFVDILRMLEESWDYEEGAPSTFCDMPNAHCHLTIQTSWLHDDEFCDLLEEIWLHQARSEGSTFLTDNAAISHKQMQRLLDGMLKLLNFRGRSHA